MDGQRKISGRTGLYDMGKELLILGENEKTVLMFDATETGGRDGHAMVLLNEKSVVRNLTYVFTPKYESATYSNAIFGFSSGNAENVFFRINSKIGTYLYNGTTTADVINCTFFHDRGIVNENWSGVCNFRNIATNVETKGSNINVITENFGTASMSLEDLIKASKENAAFQENQVGVYYGEHAWK